ncbi:thermonuclease family protein [Aminobacter ciceronei]|uniref:Endonuclease YncB(Thermonuclease family) n=1 Tax=Aminobacter ciceronei TaxID=150723 RepID=A0ABR6CFT1_9HYPH|nr:thermonuclease family protein [Aminobacter ciceronei]MBA8910137.1 endonuclease YncB(thermonuclease family) [Aminobacter ciceronei]MBA9023909.1 endonuclease YncB(thermonuclease family) [Aminobacter ciceronei]
MLTLIAATVISCMQLSAVDGDTIKCNGQNMRLIGDGVPFKSGIDTPETGGLAKCARERMLGKEAKKRLAELLRDPGGVRIEDTGQVDDTDQRRPLVRVRLGNGKLAENVLLQEGHAIRWRPKMKRPWCG